MFEKQIPLKPFLRAFLIVLCTSFVLTSCADKEEEKLRKLSIEEEEVLNSLLETMENHSVNRLTIDWDDFREQVFAEAIANDFIFPAYRKALQLLGDNHSQIRLSDGRTLFEGEVDCELVEISTPEIPEDIGYAKVNSFTGGLVEADIFIQEIREQIKASDKPNLEGWIVDLRGNLGGNMWPMISGIGPILGEGLAGHFIRPEEPITPWGFRNNAAFISDISFYESTDSYELLNKNPKVALLIDNAVTSSGEAVAISFIGRENTRRFGIKTCGLSTGNSGFPINDDVTLILTTSIMADRFERAYGNEILPDVEVPHENMIDTAIEWLRED